MKHTINRICSLLLVLALAATMLCTGAFALNYGEEWVGSYTPAAASFYDVSSTDWFYNAVQRTYAKGWMDGYPDRTFRPNNYLSRAEAVTIIVKFLGLATPYVNNSSFYDVGNHWAKSYIEAGKDLFPAQTTIQGRTPFNPEMPVTREDITYAMVRALGYGNDVRVVDQSVLRMFSDHNSISTDMRPYFAIGVNRGIISGYGDSTIRAQNSLTRAEYCSMLYRASFIGSNNSFTQTPSVSSVTLIPCGTVNLTPGGSINLTARATYSDGSNQAYTELQPYDASGNGVVVVSGTTVTALKEGTAVIKFSDTALQSKTLTVVVATPKAAPVLKIISYDRSVTGPTAAVVGVVTDDDIAGVTLTAGGCPVNLSNDGTFQTFVNVVPGTNRITFTARDAHGLTDSQTVSITGIAPAPAGTDVTFPIN